MKARVKATGEIIDAVITQRVTHTGEQIYMTNDGRLIEESRLEFNVDDTPDYWTRLEHQYAGMAMQGMLSDNVAMEQIVYNQEGMIAKIIANFAVTCATALVEKLKEKEETK